MGRAVPVVEVDWQAALRSRGYRLTPQRQLVLEAVAALGHATPEDVAVQVQRTARSVNLSTVYRTLELLEQLGLVRHNHLQHGSPAWSLVDDDDHVHLVCRTCRSVEDVPRSAVAAVAEELRARRGFVVDVGHLTVFGTCRDCAVAGDRGSASGGAPLDRT